MRFDRGLPAIRSNAVLMHLVLRGSPSASCIGSAKIIVYVECFVAGEVSVERPEINFTTIQQSAAMVRYPLTDERAAELVPHLTNLLAALDMLDEISLGETPPAAAFDPRWEE